MHQYDKINEEGLLFLWLVQAGLPTLLRVFRVHIGPSPRSSKNGETHPSPGMANAPKTKTKPKSENWKSGKAESSQSAQSFCRRRRLAPPLRLWGAGLMSARRRWRAAGTWGGTARPAAGRGRTPSRRRRSRSCACRGSWASTAPSACTGPGTPRWS